MMINSMILNMGYPEKSDNDIIFKKKYGGGWKKYGVNQTSCPQWS